MRLECNTCHGKYERTQNNTRYFHRCPPNRANLTDARIPMKGERNENIRIEGAKPVDSNRGRDARTIKSTVSMIAEGKGTTAL